MTSKNIVYLVLPFFLLFSFPSSAADTDELEKRLESMEKEISKLEKDVKRAKKVGKKAHTKLDDYANKIRINGFMTAGIATHNAGDVVYEGITDEVSAQPDTRLGLQLVANMTDRSSVTIQLVGQADNDRVFDTNMEWAFLSYKATDKLTLRAGRLRTPFYMYSEFIDVGFTYPWVRPPTEVYNIDDLKGFEGFDLLYNYSLASWSGLLQIDGGTGVSETDPKQFDLMKSWGINTTLSYDAWTFRVGARGGRVRFYNEDLPSYDNQGPDQIDNIELDHNHNPILSAPVADNLQLQQLSQAGLTISDAKEMPVTYYSLGGQYDNGSLFVIAEAVRLDWDFDDFTIGIPDAFSGLLGTDEIIFPPSSGYDSYYITVGYRIKKWSPYLTVATIDHFSDASDQDRLVFDQIIAFATGDDLPTEAAEMRKTSSYTAGLNYNLTSNIKLKGAVQHFGDFSGSVGDFGGHAGMDGKNVYTFLVDVIF